MRKPQLSESIIIGYSLYMWFTLTLDKEFLVRGIEGNPDSMYRMYLELMGTQQNVVNLSFVVAILTIIVLFVNNYTARIVVSIVGLVYFTLLAVSFVFSYPNLGLGLAAIVVVIIISNINLLIDEQSERAKKRIMCESVIKDDEVSEIDEGGVDNSESKEQ